MRATEGTPKGPRRSRCVDMVFFESFLVYTIRFSSEISLIYPSEYDVCV